MQNGYLRRFAPLRVLSEEQALAIHQTALSILETCGANIRHETALRLLSDAGCLVDFDTEMARIPPALAEECLRLAPSTYHIRARDPRNDVAIGGRRVHFMQGMGMRFVDTDTWELRPATLREHDEAQIVADALPNVHVLDACFAYADLVDVPPVMVQLEALASGFRNSTKAQHHGYLKDSDRFAIEMAQGLGVTLDTEVDIAPAVAMGHDAVETVYRFAGLGWGIQACPGGQAGATAPASFAGAAAQHWAAFIACVVLAQLVRKGAPVGLQLAGWAVHTKWATPLIPAPEAWYLGAMTNQLCLDHGVPITTPTGYCGQAKMFDYQSATEKALGILTTVLSGSHLHVLHGSHMAELGFSNVLQVMDDDIAGAVGRFLEGTVIDDETLAFEVIREVGTAPASFLSNAHTRKFWAKDRFTPLVADWDTHVEWVADGKKTLVQRATQKVEQILAEHRPVPLSAEHDRLLREVLEEARRHYRAAGEIPDEEWEPYQRMLRAADAG